MSDRTLEEQVREIERFYRENSIRVDAQENSLSPEEFGLEVGLKYGLFGDSSVMASNSSEMN